MESILTKMSHSRSQFMLFIMMNIIIQTRINLIRNGKIDTFQCEKYSSFHRFSPEEKANRDPLTYLPFGYGPRNCIGMRFAYFEIWMTLAHLLKNYRFYSIPGSPVRKKVNCIIYLFLFIGSSHKDGYSRDFKTNRNIVCKSRTYLKQLNICTG